MPHNDPFAIATSPAPIAIGTGLVALDIVVKQGDAKAPREWLGGSCGNVLAALSYLGWRSKPVTRLGLGPATKRIRKELDSWKLSSDFVTASNDGSTPIIIERITVNSAGIPRHSFSWRCLACGKPFPGYKPVLASAIPEIVDRLGSVQVFYFDRVSAGAIILAEACAAKGALVVFEPSGISNPVQFRQAWRTAHVVKYAHERLSDLSEFEALRGPLLQVETLGDAGLRYRSRPANRRASAWVELPSFPTQNLRDAAGAGDWCTVGLIHCLAQSGASGLYSANKRSLESALQFGQALAVWTCGFEGARGGMYATSRDEFQEAINQLLLGHQLPTFESAHAEVAARSAAAALCGACGVRSVRRPIRSVRG